MRLHRLKYEKLTIKNTNMADITKCTNIECSLSHKCYRISAKNSIHQSFSHFTPNGNMCKYFLDAKLWKDGHLDINDKM